MGTNEDLLDTLILVFGLIIEIGGQRQQKDNDTLYIKKDKINESANYSFFCRSGLREDRAFRHGIAGEVLKIDGKNKHLVRATRRGRSTEKYHDCNRRI